MIEPIKREFQASDTAMGLITGLVFAGFYAAASLPVGRLADRYPRKIVLAACLGFWSLMTSLGGLTQSLLQLGVTRIGVAVAESGASPTTHSTFSDLYGAGRRATVIGIFGAASSLGIGLGLYLGGVLSEAHGWRASLLLVGAPGVALALLILLTLREAPRGLADGVVDRREMAPFGSAILRLLRKRSYVCLLLTIGLCDFTGTGITVWGPSFLIRVHHLSPSQVGLWFGGVVAVSLILGNILGGVLADLVGKSDLRKRLLLAGIGPLLALPAMAVFVLADDWRLAMAGLFLAKLFSIVRAPICFALGQTLAPLRTRATSSVLIGLASIICGAGLAPLAIGMLNDGLVAQHGLIAIRYSLGIICLATLAGGAAALIGAAWLNNDLESSSQ